MIQLKENKSSTEHKETEIMPPPKLVYLPVSQHLGSPAEPIVTVGQQVLCGQMIASSQAKISSPVHASVSGKVVSIQNWPHPVLGASKTIVIESDLKDTSAYEKNARSVEEVKKLSPRQLRQIIFDAGIVGLGGASFPTHIKLSPPNPLDNLIINGAECEPYLTSDFRLMMEKTKEIISGIDIIRTCTGAKNIYIAIEDNKPEAITAFKETNRQPNTKIVVLKSQYPQGGEKQLIKSVLKREVPSGKLPFDTGTIVQNVATVYAIYEAVYIGKPLYERIVTLSGNCLNNPGNILARIGTTIKDLVAFCSGLKKEPKSIIFGGPMMGIAQHNLDTPIIKNTNGVLLFSENIAKVSREEACIRCGRCVEYCPLGLAPCLLSLAVEKEKWDYAKSYGCLDCMECGLCSYICPQKRNIVQAIKLAKLKVRK